MLGFKVFYHTTGLLFSSFCNLVPSLYYLNAIACYKKHACNLKEFKKIKNFDNFDLLNQHREGACLDSAGWLSYKFAPYRKVNLCHFLLSS